MNAAVITSKEPACGHYAARHRRAPFLAFSHNARFAHAERLVKPFAGRTLLDYGCGDGTFLARVRHDFPHAIGADTAEDQIADCSLRFGPDSTIRFATCADLGAESYTSTFDVICCMEVLEHCPEPAVKTVLSDIARLAAPGATVLISVPIEIGPSLILKQGLRRVAGWLGITGYRKNERYRLSELWRMVFAGAESHIERPVYGLRDASGCGGYHGHKGFNWLALRRELASRFEIQRIDFTPLPKFRRLLNSQVWFICRVSKPST